MSYIKETLQALWGLTSEGVNEGKSVPRICSFDISSANPETGTKSRESHDYMRALNEFHITHEGDLAVLPAALSPTPLEKLDWLARSPTPDLPLCIGLKLRLDVTIRIQKLQAFPTEGRSQSRMASSEMGTTSKAEAQSVPGQWLHEHLKGILVTTEVKREIVEDPNFPSMNGVSCLGLDADTNDGLGNGGGPVPSLDELPLPEGAFGMLS